MFLIFGTAIIVFGCEKSEKNEPEFPGLSKSDLGIAAMKSAKVKRTFEGKCTPVEMTAEINKWYDATDDWRVTGTTIWVTAADGFYGTSELFVDARNPHDENRGKWEIEWKGEITFSEDGKGALVVATAVGKGVEGKVKGMKAKWTYTMNYVGDLSNFPDPTNPTFFYLIEGNIE